MLLFAVGAEGIFVGLNINGTIIEENQMLNEFKDKATDMLEDMEEKAKDIIDN